MKKDEERTAIATVVTEGPAEEEGRFTAADERLLRMRYGATLPANEPLGSKLDGVAAEHLPELTARLALIEAGLLEDMHVAERRKTRIVDALRQIPDAEDE